MDRPSGARTAGTVGARRSRGRGPLAAAVVNIWLLPVYLLVGTALHDHGDAVLGGWWEPPFGLGSFTEAFAWDRGLLRSVGLTAFLAGFVTVIVAVVALLAAYSLAWVAPPGAHVAGVLLLLAAVVPIQVVATPVTDVLEMLGVANSAFGLVLVHAALGLPFAVLLLRNALADLPPGEVRRTRQDHARRVDATPRRNGLTRSRVWRTAVRETRILRSLTRKPSTRSVLTAVALLELVQVWNDLVVGFLFGGAETVPLGVLVHGEARQFVTNTGPLAAAAVVMAVVPVLLLTLGYKRIVEGLVTGVES